MITMAFPVSSKHNQGYFFRIITIPSICKTNIYKLYQLSEYWECFKVCLKVALNCKISSTLFTGNTPTSKQKSNCRGALKTDRNAVLPCRNVASYSSVKVINKLKGAPSLLSITYNERRSTKYDGDNSFMKLHLFVYFDYIFKFSFNFT